MKNKTEIYIPIINLLISSWLCLFTDCKIIILLLLYILAFPPLIIIFPILIVSPFLKIFFEIKYNENNYKFLKIRSWLMIINIIIFPILVIIFLILLKNWFNITIKM